MFKLLLQPSSFAGYALILSGVGSVVAGDYVTGAGQVFGGLAAVFRSEVRAQ